MKKIILLYNFTADRVKLVRRAASPLCCMTVSVSKKDFSQPVGALAGLPGYTRVKNAGSRADDFDGEMLVMCGFSGDGIDIVLGALKQAGVGPVPIKAVITPTNAQWSGKRLFEELCEEHRAMTGN